VVLKIPPTLTTWEALQFRATIECEIEEMRRDGIAPDIPYDFDDEDRLEEPSHVSLMVLDQSWSRDLRPWPRSFQN
jgi:hypothetical protein